MRRINDCKYSYQNGMTVIYVGTLWYFCLISREPLVIWSMIFNLFIFHVRKKKYLGDFGNIIEVTNQTRDWKTTRIFPQPTEMALPDQMLLVSSTQKVSYDGCLSTQVMSSTSAYCWLLFRAMADESLRFVVWYRACFYSSFRFMVFIWIVLEVGVP